MLPQSKDTAETLRDTHILINGIIGMWPNWFKTLCFWHSRQMRTRSLKKQRLAWLEGPFGTGWFPLTEDKFSVTRLSVVAF